MALFYFAGHGVQVEQENYLIPTDYAGQTSSALRFNAVSAVDIEDMLRPARVAMLVFDACRNNPYRGVRGGAGLAPMEARGTLIAYAAGAGEFAADAVQGESNGLFTSKFIEVLGEPGLTASALFMRVRQEVVAASNEDQWPAVYNNLLSDFVFRPVAVAGGGGASDPPVEASASAILQQETMFWQSVSQMDTVAAYEEYERQYPNGRFSGLSRVRRAELSATGDPPTVEAPAAPGRRYAVGEVFRDCDECPEMVVLPGGVLALGRYEVTVGEYRAFASATGDGAGGRCIVAIRGGNPRFRRRTVIR